MSTETSFRCFAMLTDLPTEGLSAVAQHRLSGSRARFPASLNVARKDVVRLRAETLRRMSISGVQDKISLRLVRGRLVPTETGGTHILKPVPGSGALELVDDVPANEALTMHLAEVVGGCTVADYGLLRLADGSLAYITRRFDRVSGSDTKLIQEDCGVLAGRSQESHGMNYKYDFSYEEIGRLLMKHCTAPLPSCFEFFRRVLFSYVIGNGDAHLRNFSVLRDLDGMVRLSPAYDLLSSTIHVPQESPLALTLLADGEFTLAFQARGFYSAPDFREFGRRIGLTPGHLETEIERYREPRFFDVIQSKVWRSFLSAPAQEAFVRIIRDRLRAIHQDDL